MHVIARDIYSLIEDFGNIPKHVIARIALVKVVQIEDLLYKLHTYLIQYILDIFL